MHPADVRVAAQNYLTGAHLDPWANYVNALEKAYFPKDIGIWLTSLDNLRWDPRDTGFFTHVLDIKRIAHQAGLIDLNADPALLAYQLSSTFLWHRFRQSLPFSLQHYLCLGLGLNRLPEFTAAIIRRIEENQQLLVDDAPILRSSSQQYETVISAVQALTDTPNTDLLPLFSEGCA